MKPDWIARQSRRPSGWVGEVVARVMARETRAANAIALNQLPLEPGDAVLEIGCGHGRTLAMLARRATDGFVAGIDPSDVMARLATRAPPRRRSHAGRAEVHEAEAARIPFEDARFDAALAVHVLYFWPEPAVELREIRRVLRPAGTLLLGFRPNGPGARSSLPCSVYHLLSLDAAEKLLREAGFEVAHVEEDALGGTPFTCVTARASEARPSPGRPSDRTIGRGRAARTGCLRERRSERRATADEDLDAASAHVDREHVHRASSPVSVAGVPASERVDHGVGSRGPPVGTSASSSRRQGASSPRRSATRPRRSAVSRPGFPPSG